MSVHFYMYFERRLTYIINSILVPIHTNPEGLDRSLTASEVIMPESAPARSIVLTDFSGPGTGMTTPELGPSTPAPSTPTMASDSPLSSENGDSSASLLDEFETASDAEYWEASRSQMGRPFHAGADIEYVVLYDEESGNESH